MSEEVKSAGEIEKGDVLRGGYEVTNVTQTTMGPLRSTAIRFTRSPGVAAILPTRAIPAN